MTKQVKPKKVNRKVAEQVIEHWKNNCVASGFISDSLDALNVNPVDFQFYLSQDEELQIHYDKVYQFIFNYKEDLQAKIAYSNTAPNSKILMRMIEGRNRKMYDKTIKVEKTNEVADKSDEELDSEILVLFSALKNKDNLER